LYKTEGNISLMMITVNAEKFNSLDRGTLIYDIQDSVAKYSENLGKIRYSGLPFIREVIAKKIQSELGVFVGLALLITAIILYLFFRSFRVVAACLLVVGIGVVFTLGTAGILNYPLSMLMSVIPPVIIVIGIPNCIFLLNKYHGEYSRHGNKIKALSRIIQKIGNATFLTNTTTALGFATFIFTSSDKLQQFGIVASINIMLLFLVSLCLIPIIFSFLNPPADKHLKHLENRFMILIVSKLESLVTTYRNYVYLVVLVVVGVSVYGMSLMVTTGNMASDLPKGDPLLEDLKHFEEHFGGVMPFEILVDTRRKGGATDKVLLMRLERLQKFIKEYKLNDQIIFSRALCVADAVKFANQAMNDGDTAYYNLDMGGRERLKLKKYIENSTEGTNVSNNFIDTTGRITRVSVQIADIGSLEMEKVTQTMQTVVDTILNPDKAQVDSLLRLYKNATTETRDAAAEAIYLYDGNIRYRLEEMYIAGDTALGRRFAEEENLIYKYHSVTGFDDSLYKVIDERTYTFKITGTSVVLARGTSYMVDNLVLSLSIAIVIISIIMSLLFRSWKMVIVSLLPNFVPLLFTAGIMGFLGIPIKPSTMLVFSIAFGISVDDTIHFLAKYRQELRHKVWDIRGSALISLRESGTSMIYTSVVLFFGFSIFTLSSFGGTMALGLLVSLTLLIAMITNLLLLPSLLLSLHKLVTTRAFNKPYIEIYEENDEDETEGGSENKKHT
jgi:predicted RND superfamily exporter protein